LYLVYHSEEANVEDALAGFGSDTYNSLAGALNDEGGLCLFDNKQYKPLVNSDRQRIRGIEAGRWETGAL